jgi:hypothetical protein
VCDPRCVIPNMSWRRQAQRWILWPNYGEFEDVTSWNVSAFPALPQCPVRVLRDRGRDVREYYFVIHRWQAQTCISVVMARMEREMRDWVWGAYTSLLPQPLRHCSSSMYTLSCNRFRVFQQPTWECRAARGEQPRDDSSRRRVAAHLLAHSKMKDSWTKKLKEIGFYYARHAKNSWKKLVFTTPAVELCLYKVFSGEVNPKSWFLRLYRSTSCLHTFMASTRTKGHFRFFMESRTPDRSTWGHGLRRNRSPVCTHITRTHGMPGTLMLPYFLMTIRTYILLFVKDLCVIGRRP